MGRCRLIPAESRRSPYHNLAQPPPADPDCRLRLRNCVRRTAESLVWTADFCLPPWLEAIDQVGEWEPSGLASPNWADVDVLLDQRRDANMRSPLNIRH